MSKQRDPLKNVKVYHDKMGHRQYTLASLREKIEDQFRAETEGRVDILSDLDTRPKRMQHIMEVAEYVLSTEYIAVPPEDKRYIVEEAVSNLFYFGALDRYFRDEDVTELTIQGPFDAFYRTGFGALTQVSSPFDDVRHLEETLTRLIAPAGGVLMESQPFVEVGIQVHDRPVRVSLIGPPINPMYAVEMRLHPVKPYTKEELVPDFIPEIAWDLVLQILNAGKGLIVTGEVGVGKTTILNTLLTSMEDQSQVVVVERAKEMNLPDKFERLSIIPPKPDTTGKTFEEQITDAMQHHAPRLLALDEIRGDESQAFWTALTNPDVSQMLIAFRGSSNHLRLHSALGITVRKSYPSIESEKINAALLAKLPFIIAVQRSRKDQPPRMTILGQWVAEGDGLTIEPLVKWFPGQEPERTEAIARGI